jgi:hypothetical protein
MGDFSLTCSISGLGISGGTPVRCLLLTASPYTNDDARRAWLVRTPPLRAVYNSYGNIERVHKGDKFVADLWLRGLREDLIEKGLGDNSCHDLPASKDMSFEELLDAIQEHRVEVRQDAKHFWRRHVDLSRLYDDETKAGLAATPDLRRIERVLSEDAALIARHPDPVARGADENKFVVDEPVPHLVRVRFGRYQHGKEHLAALHDAREAIERAGFVGVVAAGSGRYANDADLLVLPAPNAAKHLRGPQWDMASGQSADADKRLSVAMAMVREDVWQALARYPHSESVAIDCTTCGQQSWYHEKDRQCPSKSVNKKPFKKHPKGSRYTHGPVFPDGVEHVVVPREYGETVWYDVAAFKAGAHATWSAILDHFDDRPEKMKPKKMKAATAADEDTDKTLDKMMRSFDKAREKEQKRVAALPPEERAQIEADQKAQRAAWEAQERDRKENPHFGDFLISDFIVSDAHRPGAWLFRDSVPGVIGITAHLSMCLADKVDVPATVIDSLAELSAVARAMHGVGVAWKPSLSTGPQYPEWDQHVRFARTLLDIASTEGRKSSDDDRQASPASLTEVMK